MSNFNSFIIYFVIFDGVMCVMLVDSVSGMIFVLVGDGIDFEFVVVGNIEVVCVKFKIMQVFKFDDVIDDILIMFSKQYYIICFVVSKFGLFFYVVFDKNKLNLVLVWCKVQEIEQSLSF